MLCTEASNEILNETHGIGDTNMFSISCKGSTLQILSVLDVNGHIIYEREEKNHGPD